MAIKAPRIILTSTVSFQAGYVLGSAENALQTIFPSRFCVSLWLSAAEFKAIIKPFVRAKPIRMRTPLCIVSPELGSALFPNLLLSHLADNRGGLNLF